MKGISNMEKFGWKPGSMIRIDPQAAGERMAELTKKHGFITRHILVKEGKLKRSPFHGHFDWDKNKAANEHWLTQAGQLLRCITVNVQLEGREESKPMRYFVHVKDSNLSSYQPIMVAMKDVDTRTLILQRAWRELEDFRRRYEDIEELAAIFIAMEKAKKPTKVRLVVKTATRAQVSA